ncbi:hypothetical protein GpartN1_g4340.t1 [Galdieria partita]|uniref:U5 small nuclear ribonucleoprotein 200 kDa helicase n=1 Tax=Galdieria partita TaxID=83374 RepID=A0A9C7UR23_9RHOD|nr:hypothetical protein GpartN1_g4340.t1 [Galdieria partita]
MSFPPKFRNYLLAQKGQPLSEEQLEQVARQRWSFFQRQQSSASSSSTVWSEQEETEMVDYLLSLLSIIAAVSGSPLDERLEHSLVALLRCYEEFLHNGEKDWLQSTEEAFQQWIVDKLGWVWNSQQVQTVLSLLERLASDTNVMLIFQRGEEKRLSRQLERCFRRACERKRWEDYCKSSNSEFLAVGQPKVPDATQEWLNCYPEWNSEFEQQVLQKVEEIRRRLNHEETLSPVQEIYGKCREFFRRTYFLNDQQPITSEEEQKISDDCMQSIFNILATSQSSEQLQEQLFDLVGDFELVSELLQHREELISVYYPKEKVGYVQNASSLVESSNPTHASSIRDIPSLLSERLESLSVQGENGYYGSEPFLKLSLPKGSTRQSHVGYEEYWIPPASHRVSDEDNLLRVSQEIDSCFLPVFEDIDFLNPIQSKVFYTAYHTNENLLISAPTGAGKTNIALLTVLHVLKDKWIHHQATDGPHIVYVAPMKALASEVVENFQRRLKCLGVVVQEMTGDMQLSYQEAKKTDMIVTTPEKWDIVTRKGTDGSDDSSIHANLKLLIIDEIHLLHELRGVILEAVVARTLKMVETSQRMIRLVGLSATLPNYEDIAEFLRVNRDQGLYYFDASYRPVPLSLTFIGLSSRLPEEEEKPQEEQQEENLNGANKRKTKKKTDLVQLRQEWMNKLCFEQLHKFLQHQQQVLVFVHSRQDTSRTARAFLQYINRHGLSHLLDDSDQKSTDQIKVAQFKSSDLREFVPSNVAIHHAGLLRSDRSYVEELFRQGLLRVVICTATLAWGVNLPAHAVIIKGTQIYDASRGGFTELSMLDVMQIFGRAGRPQFDTQGEAVMITTHQQLPFYLRLLTSQLPIESQLCHLNCLADHLNAEIVLGNISNVMQGVEWLEYTYLATRMRKNPLAYGISWQELLYDPSLMTKKREMIIASAKILDESRMIRFDPLDEVFYSTELGRIASHFYVCNGTIHKWNEMLRADLSDSEVIRALSMADEMETIKFRDDELPELQQLSQKCPIRILGALEHSKVVILLQSYISRLPVHASALISDTYFIIQNAGRLAQALFEIVLGRAWPSLSYTILQLCRSIQRRIWPFQHPLRQLAGGDGERKKHSSNKHPHISAEICYKLEQLGPSGEFSHLIELGVDELSSALRAPQAAKNVMRCISLIPQIFLEAEAYPLTSTVIQIQLSWKPHFYWNDHLHGILEQSQERHPESWWLWVEDTETEQIYHSEQISVTKRLAQDYWKHPDKEPQIRSFSIAVYEPISPQYVIRACSANWHGADTVVAISFYGLQLPRHETVYSSLLDLQPLHRSCLFLGSHLEQILYPNIRYFNPLQTQVFHVAYHTDENILFAAPTGSGKTAIAEFAMLRCMRSTKERGIMGRPGLIVYIAPLKALVRERAQDWRKRFGDPSLGKVIIELTGEDSPGNISTALKYADIICTTPEKWDSISRGWRRRKQVLEVTLYILDEVHLLGSERGPVLEMIVSRAKRLALKHNIPVRWIALSTALANPVDLASWLGVEEVGMFNFRPSVRPVPCEVHIMGVAGKHYSPRMTAMNKPAYQAIRQYSPHKPVLIFVSSRRQTRRTALEMIRCAASDGNPHFFLKSDISKELASIEDSSLKSTLEYGVGIHHGGLLENDRIVVEQLFSLGKIHLLVCTATLAWGVNLPAHLVIIKGTEYYDAKSKTYIDMPITDILQMMGRAGRPQYDDKCFAFILVHEPKKNFYKKFLYEPFPVESNLWKQLEDPINAEVAGGWIRTAQDAVDFLTWSFFFRRLLCNPAYYHLQHVSAKDISEYTSRLVQNILQRLEKENCITIYSREGGEVDDDTPKRWLEPEMERQHQQIVNALQSTRTIHLSPIVVSTFLGKVATFYYLSYKSVGWLGKVWTQGASFMTVLIWLTSCEEFSDIPVRHNEDNVNALLLQEIQQQIATFAHPTFVACASLYQETVTVLERTHQTGDMEDPHCKALLLFCAHMSRCSFSVVDYYTDLLTALEQAGRVLQAMIDIAVQRDDLVTAIACIHLSQCLSQGCWPWEFTFSRILETHLPDCDRLWLLQECGIKETGQDFYMNWKDRKASWLEPLEESQRQTLQRLYSTVPVVRMQAQWNVEDHSIQVNLNDNKQHRGLWMYSLKRRANQETWYLLLIDTTSGRIGAFRRIRSSKRISTKVLYPENRWTKESSALLLLSATYRGVDQMWRWSDSKTRFLSSCQVSWSE